MKTQSTANPTDVASVDAVIKALYASISFPVGGNADLERLRTLWIAEGRFLIPKRDQQHSNSTSVDQFIERCKTTFASERFLGKGFREVETNRQEHRFGNILHCFSAYEAIISDPHDSRMGGGINSIQLVWEDNRWWIVSMVWDDERPDNPLPDWAKY